MEQCERCGGPLGPGRTVVLSSGARGELREHLYCGSACALAPGGSAANTLEALAARHQGGNTAPTIAEAPTVVEVVPAAARAGGEGDPT